MKNKKYILRPNHGSNAVFKSLNKNTAKRLIKFVNANILDNGSDSITINNVKYTLINWHYSRDGYKGISFYFITDTNKYIRISNHWCSSNKLPPRKVQMVSYVGKSDWYLSGADNSFQIKFVSNVYSLEGGVCPINKFIYRSINGRIDR